MASGLTSEELRRVLTVEQRNALVLVSRWRDVSDGRERAAAHLRVSEAELSELLAEARRRIAAALEAKGRARRDAPPARAERNGEVAEFERDQLRRGLPPLRSTGGEAATRRTATGKRPKGMRAAEFRGALADGDRTQAEVRKLIGVGAPESKRLKDRLVGVGHVVETGEVRGRSPVLRLTDAGRQGDSIRFEAGTGQRDGRDASPDHAGDASSIPRPVGAAPAGELGAAARPVSDHPPAVSAPSAEVDYVIADGATVCPLCGGTLR